MLTRDRPLQPLAPATLGAFPRGQRGGAACRLASSQDRRPLASASQPTSLPPGAQTKLGPGQTLHSVILSPASFFFFLNLSSSVAVAWSLLSAASDFLIHLKLSALYLLIYKGYSIPFFSRLIRSLGTHRYRVPIPLILNISFNTRTGKL